MKARQSPSISIIVPVYNCEDYISDCIGSIKRQSFSNLEVICVNDCSTDRSLEVLKRETSSDPRFKVISLDKNAGQGHARNLALDQATGEYIQFLDADDYIVDNCCEILYNTAKELNLDILMYSGKNFFVKEKLNANPYWDYGFLPKGFKTIFNYKDCSGFIGLLPVSAGINFYKRELINNNDIRFPEGLYFEDTFFDIKALFNASRISIKNEKLYMRRLHSQSTTQNWKLHLGDYVDVLSHIMDFFKSSTVQASFITEISDYLMSCTLFEYENLSQTKQRELKSKITDVAAKHKIANTIFSVYPKFGIVRQRGDFRQFRLFGIPIVEIGYANNKNTFLLWLLGKNIYKKTAK